MVGPSGRTFRRSLSFNHYIFFLQRLIVSNDVVVFVVLLAGVLYLLVDGRSGGDAESSAVVSSNLLVLASGSANPPLIYQPMRVASKHDHLNARLSIDAAAVSFANGVSFNGSFPDPIFVVHPGDTLTVTLCQNIWNILWFCK